MLLAPLSCYGPGLTFVALSLETARVNTAGVGPASPWRELRRRGKPRPEESGPALKLAHVGGAHGVVSCLDAPDMATAAPLTAAALPRAQAQRNISRR